MKILELKIPPPLVMLVFAGLMKLSAGLFALLNYPFTGHQAFAVVLLLIGLSIDITGIAGFLRAKTTVNP